jgi:hypothetical protein
MDALASGNADALRGLIPDEAYRRNFVGLARRIAPDGSAVSSVGFTSQSTGVQKQVLLTRVPSEIPPLDLPGESVGGETITVEGVLKYADSTRSNRVKLVNGQRGSHVISVPEGMMDDVVRPYWDCNVRVTCVRKGNSLVLVGISEGTTPEEA